MNTAQFKIRKEAAWAVLNATAGGTPQQIRYVTGNGSGMELNIELGAGTGL